MLITLVIIGIIAALTIPNLLQKYQEQATVKKVQKFYSNLSNTYSLAMKENGPVSDWGLIGATSEDSSTKIYDILFKQYYKIAKDCCLLNKGNCVANGKYKSGHISYNKQEICYNFLKAGSVLYFDEKNRSDIEALLTQDYLQNIGYNQFSNQKK